MKDQNRQAATEKESREAEVKMLREKLARLERKAKTLRPGKYENEQ